MRTALSVLFAAVMALAFSQEPPKNLRVSTWVREDLFAGYLDGDMTRHALGVRKLEAALAGNPKAADAIGWQGGNYLLSAVLAHDAGNPAGFEKEYTKALASFARAAEIAKEVPPARAAVLAITGGAFTIFADRLPMSHRREAWLKVRENYTALRELQKDQFDQFPDHFRGEIMGGLAQAAQRLGEAEKATTLTRELVAALPGTPYAVFGKRWLDKPETMAKTKITCSGCHDAGRLQAVLARAPRN